MSQIPPVYRTGHGLDDELRQRVRGRGNAVLATIDHDGSPQLTELLYLLDEEDRLCLPTPHSTRKVRNIAARPLVTAYISLDRGWALSWSPDGIMPSLEAHDDIGLASHPPATWWRDLSTS